MFIMKDPLVINFKFPNDTILSVFVFAGTDYTAPPPPPPPPPEKYPL